MRLRGSFLPIDKEILLHHFKQKRTHFRIRFDLVAQRKKSFGHNIKRNMPELVQCINLNCLRTHPLKLQAKYELLTLANKICHILYTKYDYIFTQKTA